MLRLKGHEEPPLSLEERLGRTRGGREEERGAQRSLAYSVEDPLTLFIRVVSLKARGKGKLFGRVDIRKTVDVLGTEGDREERAAQGPR